MIRTAFILALAAATASCASPVLSRQADPLCPSITECLAGHAICVHVGAGSLALAELQASEAYRDMEAQLAPLGKTHLLPIASIDRLVSGATERENRTLIFGKAGEALIYPEVFADDATAMASYFNQGGAVPEGFSRARVQLRPGACP